MDSNKPDDEDDNVPAFLRYFIQPIVNTGNKFALILATVWEALKSTAKIAVYPVVKPVQLATAPFVRIARKLIPDLERELKYDFYFYLFSWALAIFSLVVLAIHKDNATYNTICICLGIVACAAYGNRIASAAAPAVAVSIEILIEVYEASTLVQIVTTVAVFALVCALKYTIDRHQIDVNVQYAFVWVIFRLVRAMQLNTSPPAQWRLSQICLFAMVVVHLLRRFVPRQPGDDAFWALAASGETIVNGGLLIVVLLLYDEAHVLPWEIHMALLVVPLAYVASATLPAEKQPYAKRSMPRRSFTSGMVEFLAGCAAIAATTGAFVYDRPVDDVATVDDPCSPELTNLHTCTSANEANRYFVADQCCMKAGYMVVPGAIVARAALEDACRPTLTTPGEKVDCCGVKRQESTDALMSGPYACMCNRDPESNNGNRLVDGACLCNTEMYSGAACETKL